MACPSCGAATTDGARFCAACGAALHAPIDERRIVSVLFADVVGFTSFSERADPERVKNLIDRLFARLAHDVEEYGGRVDKIVGDEIVALFGAPTAHEDDAERAVRAALAMQRSVTDFDQEAGAGLRVRVGVNTGEVLVGQLAAGGDYTAMGDVMNTGRRLQEHAQPGEVIVGLATHAVTRDAIRYEGRGPVQVRGREEPVETWAAVEPLGPPGTRKRRARTRLVGRGAELGLLWHALSTTVSHGRPHVVLMVGDPGVGKSRLSQEVIDLALAEHGATVLEGRCLPYGEANVWWPIAETLRQACGIAPTDPADVAIEKCRTAVAEAVGPAGEGVEAPRVADGLLYLMGYEGPLHDVEPARAREEAYWALKAAMKALAMERPLVVVISELHWADDVVLELLDRLLQDLRDLPLLILSTARPAIHDRWSPRPGRYNLVVLNLDPLDRGSASSLLDELLGADVSTDLKATILERSGGNPLFIEELAALLGDRAAAAGDVPATLRGLVAARLDALPGPERAVLEDAAVVGRRGSVASVEALAGPRGEPDAAARVRELASKDLLVVEGDTFAFKSDLVRDVAYDTLTKAGRARRHAAVAAWLEDVVDRTGREEEALERVAHHYATAAELVADLGLVEGVPRDVRTKALGWLERAAARAEARDIATATVQLLDHALRLTEDADVERRGAFLLSRARARASLRDADGALGDVDEVLSAIEGSGDREALARALSVKGEVQVRLGDHGGARDTLDRAITLWIELDDSCGEADALRWRGMGSLLEAEYEEAEPRIERALTLFRREGDRRGEAWAIQNLAWVAFLQGDHDAAEERLLASRDMFLELGDIGGEGWAMGLLGYVRYFKGDLVTASEIARRTLERTRETGDRWAHGMMLNLVAIASLWSGDIGEAIEHGEQAWTLFREIDDHVGELQTVMGLAHAHLLAGHADPGRRLVQRSYELMREGTNDAVVRVSAGSTSVLLGDAEAALEHVAKAPEDEGFGSQRSAAFGYALLVGGRFHDAIEQLEHARALSTSDGTLANALAGLALGYAAGGRPDDAVDAASALARLEGGSYLDRVRAHVGRGLAEVQRGDRDAAEVALAEAAGVLDGSGDRLHHHLLRVAREIARDPAALPAPELEALQGMGVATQGWIDLFRAAATGREPAHA